MNVLIVEDEAPAARRLERMVRDRIGARLEALGVAATVEAARTMLASSRVDLLLLDLNLNGEDGFSLLGSASRPPTIVVSANSSRAIDAFDHAVIDFVAKPVSAERLGVALDRALDRSRQPSRASLAVRSAGRIDLAAFSDIVALCGADDYVEVILADGRRFLHDTRLAELERRLPAGFMRVHRSHIVNAAHVRAIRTLPGRRRALELTGGAKVPVSRSHAGALAKRLQAEAVTSR
ncbi:MAG TPA: LytTR family DNA-binding domain-containing protein [Hyphomonadaceae bacterium]|nr:LytTR family DNA-binding domain-containing protein [Hyphomonadaceae bacterium]